MTIYSREWLLEHRHITNHEIKKLGLSEADVARSFRLNLRKPGTPVPIEPSGHCAACSLRRLCGNGENRVYCETILEGEEL